jgi:hypothetical protein
MLNFIYFQSVWPGASLNYVESQYLSIVRITIDREPERDVTCDSLAHEFSSGGDIGSAESTKMRIHEQAVFQGKIREDSQTTRTQLNNNSLTSHEVCWTIKIAASLFREVFDSLSLRRII